MTTQKERSLIAFELLEAISRIADQLPNIPLDILTKAVRGEMLKIIHGKSERDG